ncbi:MAG: helix-turn-helix transcriptional regulator [Motiliproteus sp.]|nr:helix-turn-helix transcriptional regulator [Motiliproteus sp.]MCW9054287.1 helix-turn-helix transcriptional regulator [Motiliproteus sp.]
MTKSVEKRTELPAIPEHWRENKLHPYSRPEEVPRDLVVRHVVHLSGHRVPAHSHGWAQLLYAYEGVMRVITENGQWVIPSQRAVWIPPLVVHEIECIGTIRLRNVYFRPQVIGDLPEQCCVVQVSPLLRELIAEVSNYPLLYDQQGSEGRMVNVLLDKIRVLPVSPLHLPIPSDKRLKRITDRLLADPADNRSLQQWAMTVGASERTLARLFQQHLQISFGQWRQQLRLLEAMAKIAQGQSIREVASDLGYDSQSAFIAMFKRTLGKTPKQYFSD